MLTELTILRGSCRNINGVLSLALMIIVITTGIFIAPAASILDLNPISLFVCHRWPSFSKPDTILYSFQKVLSFLICHWCSLESSPVLLVVAVSTMTVFKIYLECLKKLYKQALSESTVALYNQLYCINQAGIEVIRPMAGALLGIGFIIVVLCLGCSCWMGYPSTWNLYFNCMNSDCMLFGNGCQFFLSNCQQWTQQSYLRKLEKVYFLHK